VRVSHAADVCYVGQSHYLEVAVDLSEPEPLAAVYQRFINTHEQVFGYSTPSPARLTNLRSVHQAGGEAGVAAVPPGRGGAARATGERAVIFDDPASPLPTPVLDRHGLATGQVVDGPAIIEQPDTTTVVHPGWQARVLADGSLQIRPRSARAGG
jgi:N-methylhydantoinase A/oxoprolinase/acetone carboxylase beta subunit